MPTNDKTPTDAAQIRTALAGPRLTPALETAKLYREQALQSWHPCGAHGVLGVL
jgi:hypothetical protein